MQLPSNSSSTPLAIGLAAFGLGLVVAGLRLYRRRPVAPHPGPPEDGMQAKSGAVDEEPVPEAHPPQDVEARRPAPSNVSPRDLPLDYFLLVFVLSIPFWLVGGNKLPLPIDLPASALAFVNPLVAAAILSYRRHGFAGLRQLFAKAFDYKKIHNKIWYLPILFLLPLIMFLSYVALRLAGLPLPADPQVPLRMAPVFFLMFFFPAMFEELGWSGYALDPLQNRWGALKAGLILGFVWSLWHIIPDVQNQKSAGWIAGQRLYSVALRILIVWIYNNTGKSVFAAILVHAMDNASAFLFPNYGSHYNPWVTGIFTWLAAFIAIFRWGPKTLARYRRLRAGG